MKDFVPYELAIKLKEKGFKEKCIAYYWKKINEHTPSFVVEDNMPEDGIDLLDLLSNHNCLEWSSFIDAPTISQVLKWLREEKKIHIMIATYSQYPNNTHSWGYEIINLQTYTCKYYKYGFNSYELAALAGIQYYLENLI